MLQEKKSIRHKKTEPQERMLISLWLLRAKKVVSHSPGLVDFTVRLVNSVLNLPNGQVKFFEESNLQKNCEINSAHQNFLGGS